MILKDSDGRWKTVSTPEEAEQSLFEAVKALKPEERQALSKILEGVCKKNTKPLEIARKLEYEEEPCPPEKFLEDPLYLGDVGKGTYPWIKEVLPRIFSGDYKEIVATGSLRSGKDWMASCCISYLVHLLLCLKDPAVSYGLAKGSNIYIVFMSATQRMSKDAMYNGFIEKIKQSPWFEKWGKKIKYLSEDIRFPKGLVLKGAESNDLGVVGLATCITADTLISLPSGQETVKTLLTQHGQKPFEILSFSGSIERDTAFITPTGEQEIFELTLDDGKTIKATSNHRILVRISPKTMWYKRVEEIEEGDNIVTQEDAKRLKTPWNFFSCVICGREGFTRNRQVEWCSIHASICAPRRSTRKLVNHPTPKVGDFRRAEDL